MIVTELTKKICDESPNVWNMFSEYIDMECLYEIITIWQKRICCYTELEEMIPVPFKMLYGLLEDFFEENKIIINIVFNKDASSWMFCIVGKSQAYYYETKQQAKEAATLKACQILEEQL
jgi:hypothetical protein